MKLLSKRKVRDKDFYRSKDILKEIVEDSVDLSLEESLKQDIIQGRRKRRLKNISIKIDPLYLQSIRKIATMKGIPYQTLVRLWLAEKVKKELKLA